MRNDTGCGTRAQLERPLVTARRYSGSVVRDYEQITALLCRNDLETKTFEEWRDLWSANPEYRRLNAQWPIGWVLETDDKRIVGFLGNIPLAYTLDGCALSVAVTHAWVVDVGYRSYALLLLDCYFSQRNVDLYLTTTVNVLASQAFTAFGSQRVPVGAWDCSLFWISHYRGLVGICLHRSTALVLAALGVLKAGGAYVPFDPVHPPAHILSMLNDAAPLALITTEDLAEPLRGSWETLVLPRDADRLTSQSTEPLDCTAEPEQLAYVIYTSGSTGRPKGVQIPHRGLMNLVEWHQKAFSVTPADRATLLASPAFDASIWETWPYLATGASLHVAPDNVRSDPESLMQWLVSERITIAFAPTPLAERLLFLNWPHQTALRVLLTGADTLRRFPPSNLPFKFVNNYGLTECTVVTTSGAIPRKRNSAELLSIGRAISNVKVHILNENGQEVLCGMNGEICVSGSGLARGYLNAPELTASKFIDNLFDLEPGSRVYKTGDLGRRLSDGQIEFLGRADDQIKIRGYRVEPNEAAAALCCHPDICDCAVVTRDDKGLR